MDSQLPLPSEKFELLSAYLDGEVSPNERQQVEEWLATDAEAQHLYRQMTALHQGLAASPLPQPSVPTEQLITQVMGRIDRRPKLWVWGGTAVALLVGAFSGLLTGGNQAGLLQMAQRSPSSKTEAIAVRRPEVESTTLAISKDPDAQLLMIALERPPVHIPVVPISHRSQDSDQGIGSEF